MEVALSDLLRPSIIPLLLNAAFPTRWLRYFESLLHTRYAVLSWRRDVMLGESLGRVSRRAARNAPRTASKARQKLGHGRERRKQKLEIRK